jgi:hypothetical protein
MCMGVSGPVGRGSRKKFLFPVAQQCSAVQGVQTVENS